MSDQTGEKNKRQCRVEAESLHGIAVVGMKDKEGKITQASALLGMVQNISQSVRYGVAILGLEGEQIFANTIYESNGGFSGLSAGKDEVIQAAREGLCNSESYYHQEASTDEQGIDHIQEIIASKIKAIINGEEKEIIILTIEDITEKVQEENEIAQHRNSIDPRCIIFGNGRIGKNSANDAGKQLWNDLNEFEGIQSSEQLLTKGGENGNQTINNINLQNLIDNNLSISFGRSVGSKWYLFKINGNSGDGRAYLSATDITEEKSTALIYKFIQEVLSSITLENIGAKQMLNYFLGTIREKMEPIYGQIYQVNGADISIDDGYCVADETQLTALGSNAAVFTVAEANANVNNSVHQAITTKQVIFSSIDQNDGQERNEDFIAMGVGGLITIPIIDNTGEVTGVIEIGRKDPTFENAITKFGYERLGREIGMLLKLKKQEEAYQKILRINALTMELADSPLRTMENTPFNEDIHKDIPAPEIDFYRRIKLVPRFVSVNPKYCELTGFEESELIGSRVFDPRFMSTEEAEKIVAEIEKRQEIKKQGGSIGDFIYEALLKKKPVNDEDVCETIPITMVTKIREEDGVISASTIHDMRAINARRKEIESLKAALYTDNLTKMPNRMKLEITHKEALERAKIEQADKTNNKKLYSMFIDLDSFKPVNDSYGHRVGDEVLKQTADILKGIFEGKNGVIARIGGDEFFAHFYGTQEEMEEIANQIVKSVHEKIYVDKNLCTKEINQKKLVNGKIEIEIGTSIGISVYPKDGDDTSTLMKTADTAVYFSKEDGKNCFNMYNPNRHLKEAKGRRTIIEYEHENLILREIFRKYLDLLKQYGLEPSNDEIELAIAIGLIEKEKAA